MATEILQRPGVCHRETYTPGTVVNDAMLQALSSSRARVRRDIEAREGGDGASGRNALCVDATNDEPRRIPRRGGKSQPVSVQVPKQHPHTFRIRRRILWRTGD